MPEIKLDDNSNTSVSNNKPESGFSKMFHALINDDFDKIGHTLVHDILIPSFKNTVWGLGRSFLDMLIYGENRSDYNIGGGNASYYHNSYGSQNNKPQNQFRQDGDWFIFTSSEIKSRGDAEAKLYQLGRILDDWKYVNVGNLYTLCDETAPYTYDGYGWRSLSGSTIGMAPGGQYYIKLPRPIVLKQH